MEPMRVLCVSGMSPAIVTETVWALCMDNARDVSIYEVVVATTSAGSERLEGLKARLEEMGADWPALAPRLEGVRVHVEVVEDEAGAPLQDVRTTADNEQMVMLLQRLVERYTQPDEPRLHASLAGGRKTMGHYLGSLMSLFARRQDGVSHVLVGQSWAEQAGFWYPLPAACVEERAWFTDRAAGERHHAGEATVELCEVPLLRLRPLVVDTSYGDALGNYRFNALLSLAQQRIVPSLRVCVTRGSWELLVEDTLLELPPSAHLMLVRALLLHHDRQGVPFDELSLCAEDGGDVMERMREQRAAHLGLGKPRGKRKKLAELWQREIKLFKAGKLGVEEARNGLRKARTKQREVLKKISSEVLRALELIQSGQRDGTFTLRLPWEHIEVIDG
jgi:CRISPR-associated protein (TIGR02584 family)